MRKRTLALLLCFGWSLPRVAVAAPLHLVDDRGQAITLPLEVCLQVALRTECRQTASGEVFQLPEAFYSLRVEGEDHGPSALRREELRIQADGSFRAVVARKARLRIEMKDRRQPLTLSLYSPTDPSFREPAFRTQLAPDEAEVKIPAGAFLVSLTLGRNAPDLQRLKADPGHCVRV